MKPLKGTNENLRNHATKPLAQWLIEAAKRRSSITYGEAKLRLEKEKGFGTIFSPRMGKPAGELMDRILKVRPNCPLLNILLVKQENRMPGDGAGSYMARYLRIRKLQVDGVRKSDPKLWRDAFDKIATKVYAFNEWDQVYHEVFEESLPTPNPSKGNETDGINHGRKGEGKKHKALRYWVKNNPHKIRRVYATYRTETEVVLDSGDRVDVTYFSPRVTVAIEVKSSDSNEADIRRGVFQCIKYRAVMRAMDIRSDVKIVPFLVTQTDLPGDLKHLVRLHGITHFKAPNIQET